MPKIRQTAVMGTLLQGCALSSSDAIDYLHRMVAAVVSVPHTWVLGVWLSSIQRSESRRMVYPISIDARCHVLHVLLQKLEGS